ncbi:MAG: DUF3037 domain-containing protein [Saprospiraceae bacterium]|nr:DUF3037 domain-containing protein [Saprospiraceae bacterium]
MKQYSYQILRYIPDQVTGEFVNVGLVLFSPDTKYLNVQMLEKSGRIKAVFPAVNSRILMGRLAAFTKAIQNISSDEKSLNLIKKIEEVTKTFLAPDDSALQFSPVEAGIDINIKNAFSYLYGRLITKYETPEPTKYLTDSDVWRNEYKTYFKEFEARKLLVSHKVKTKGKVEISFDYAIKNGKWNYLEPVTFDLSNKSNITDKVFRWMGKLEELGQSDESFNLYLLSKMPEDDDLAAFIYERLGNRSDESHKIQMIKPEDANKLAKQLMKDVNH